MKMVLGTNKEQQMRTVSFHKNIYLIMTVSNSDVIEKIRKITALHWRDTINDVITIKNATTIHDVTILMTSVTPPVSSTVKSTSRSIKLARTWVAEFFSLWASSITMAVHWICFKKVCSCCTVCVMEWGVRNDVWCGIRCYGVCGGVKSNVVWNVPSKLKLKLITNLIALW